MLLTTLSFCVCLSPQVPAYREAQRAVERVDDELDALLARFCAGDNRAAKALIELGEPAVDGLLALLADVELELVTRFTAANVLGEIGSERSVLPLIAALADAQYNVRRCAALALGKCGDERARKPLLELAETDPFVFRDPKSGEDLYLVREDARRALAILDGLEPGAARLKREAEILLEDASVLPPSPLRVEVKRLPWPFAGEFERQNLFNNYQQPTDGYVHGGLDIMNPAGSEVRAVDSGWVALVSTNYPEWTTHHFFVVAEEKNGARGWCYTHLDPATFTFAIGDRIERGAVLGKLVDFKLGANEGADHLHLNYVQFAKKTDGRYDTNPLVDPLSFFEREDRVAPTIDPTLRFVRAGKLEEFGAEREGLPLVSGKVDVIAGIGDVPRPKAGCNWMAAVVTLEIRGEVAAPWRKLVLDQRGEIGDPTAASALYVKHADKQRWLAGRPAFPPLHFVIATHSDGDGRLEAADSLHAWETAARDERGAARFPNGIYEVTIRAFDLAGNRSERTVKVRVGNP